MDSGIGHSVGCDRGCILEPSDRNRLGTHGFDTRPDLVAHMACEFRILAEDRMKEINAAYTELRRIRCW